MSSVLSSVGSAAKTVGSTSSVLCETATFIFYGCMFVIPEAFFCAQTVGDGKGDSGKVLDAAQAWQEASQHLREFHDELAGIVHSVPHSEWQAADREAYEQQADKYLEQVTTSATAAEVASVLLDAAGAALFAFAAYAVAVAGMLAVDAAAVAAADCTVVGAPEAEAEGLAAGAEAFEAMEAATKVLFVALSGIATAIGAGVVVDTSVQAGQGDHAAAADFGHALVSGIKNDAGMVLKEGADYAQGKILNHFHGKWFPKKASTSSSSDSGSSSSSGSGSSSSGSGSSKSGGAATGG